MPKSFRKNILKKPLQGKEKQNHLFIFLHTSKQYRFVQKNEHKKILRFPFWTFYKCPKPKMSTDF